jgi:hypothetical protein
MLKKVHLIAGLLATLTIATFFLSTLGVELFGTHEMVATVKALIVIPGLFILVPAIAATGGSGMFLSKSRQGRLVEAKKKADALHCGKRAAGNDPQRHFS